LKDSKENITFTTGWKFDNSYTQLPSTFFTKQKPTPVIAPSMVIFNHALASSLGLNVDTFLADSENVVIAKSQALSGKEVFSGNQLPEGAEPLAQAYAGHQFGHLNMLGDGRAILLGEHITPSGVRFDIQLKGAGQTAYSRRGDGRAALGAMLREYIISEAMHALGVSTTRSLAVVTTGEPVYRTSVLPGAVLTRVAASHIRVGTFQFAASIDDDSAALKALADYTLNRHFSNLASRETWDKTGEDNKYLSLLEAVIDRQAELIAKWMQIGFIHGVMNTDNMSICGETIDYGPCAFMDSYDPTTVFSSIDQQGRYAFGNQAPIAEWNLVRFAETLLPLLHPDQTSAITIAQAALQTFAVKFRQYWLTGMRAKLGLYTEEADDALLIDGLLNCMEKNDLDYTNTFRALGTEVNIKTPMLDFPDFIAWHSLWRKRLLDQDQNLAASVRLMLSTNPAIIARNYQVESALSAAETGEFSVLEKLLEALSEPFNDNPKHTDYLMPAPLSNTPYKTYCGT
jgi:uncharacterized protein YdiU (UPF0061 family)